MRSPTSRWGKPLWMTTVTTTRLREEKQKEGKALSLTARGLEKKLLYHRCTQSVRVNPPLSLSYPYSLLQLLPLLLLLLPPTCQRCPECY